MNKRMLAAGFAFVLGSSACVKEVTSDERLERETKSTTVKESMGAADLQKIKCDDTAAAKASARNENKPETDRVVGYMELYESLKGRSAKFDEAMNRNPDLAYQQGSQELISAKEQ